MAETAKFDCEVIVCGGGPVGLCLSLLLSRAGLTTIVLEKEMAIEKDLRASTFHPPTLDMLEETGITAKLLDQGLICPDWQIRLHPDGERAVFDLSVLDRDTRYPFRLQCEQWKLSVALKDALCEDGKADIRFGTEVTGFEQDETGVTVNLRSHSGEESQLRTRFLIGADGSRSIVRKMLDIDFNGLTYPETTLLVTTHFPFEDHLEGISNVSYCWKDGGNFSLLKVPGRWRVSIYPREDLSVEDQLTADAVEASLQQIVPKSGAYDVIEKRAYRVHQRIVDNYVHQRVILVGDAAHLNSPSGGMGLNGGIHDAFELSAALSDILKHAASLDRLSLYDRRRRPVARDQILAQADANRARMREKSPEKRREILAGLQKITADRKALHAHLLKSSMIEGLRMSAAID